MPAFIVFTLGQPARRAMFELPPVRVGRDPESDLVLTADTVSREHAVFVQEEDGSWVVSCVSQKNPIVVDGRVVSTGAPVKEGTQILVGAEYLIIFSANEMTAKSYMGGSFLTQSRCGKCRWTGLASTLRAVAACPRCGSTELVKLDEYRVDIVAGHDDATTEEMTNSAAAGNWLRMKAAKRSFLERDDKHDASRNRRQLDEKQTVEIGTSDSAAFRILGVAFGSAKVKWDGSSWVVESAMKFPAMKVNGAKVDRQRLAHGDIIEIGANRFRLVIE